MLHCNSHSQPGPQAQQQQQHHQEQENQKQSEHLVTVTVVNKGSITSSSNSSSRIRSPAMSPKGDHHQQQTHHSHHHHQHRNGQNGQPVRQPLLQRPAARLQSEEDPFIRDTDSPPPPDLHVEPDVLLRPSREESVPVPVPDPLLSGHHLLSHHVVQQHHHRHHHHHHRPQQQDHDEERPHSRPPIRQSVVHVPSQSPPDLMQHPRISSSVSRRSTGPDRLSSLSQDQLALHYQKLHVSQRTMSGQIPVKPKSPTGSEVAVPAETSGTWSKLSVPVLEQILSHLSLSQVYQCSLTCVSWSKMLRNESSPVWERLARERIPASILKSDLLSSVRSPKGKLRALAHAWNPADCSRNVYIKSNGLTFHRNPVAQSTDAARGKMGYTRGRHCWEVWWEGPLGTVSMVGVCTKDQVMQASGYVPLLGSSGGQSWGWNLVDNSLVHDGEVLGSFPLHNNAPKYQTGERIRLLLDCDRHTLSFEKNYEFLGVAFVGLPTPRTRLFPAVSAVYGNTEVSILYLGLPLDG